MIPHEMTLDDLPKFPEDSAPAGFIICEACDRVTPLNTYDRHIGGQECNAEAKRQGNPGAPAGWRSVNSIATSSGVALVQLATDLRLPYHAPSRSVPPWVVRIAEANASKQAIVACLRRCRTDVEARRAVIGGLMLFGSSQLDDRDRVDELLGLAS